MNKLTTQETVVNNIRYIREQRVMLDKDLAYLYGVETKYLNKIVKRNKKRFPNDFMFKLTQKEYSGLRFQIGTSKGGLRYLPYAFTEQGVAMLSSVLNSDRAIKVNIMIMRIFVSINKVVQSDMKLTHKVYEIEKRIKSLESRQDSELREIYKAIERLIIQEEKPKREIGFDLSGVK